jgi:cytidylate kinase
MERLKTIVADIAAENTRARQEAARRRKVTQHPFITISRQPGAGAAALKDHLIERLRAVDPADPPWTGFDRELVEKVAEDHNLSERLIESLEDSRYSWLYELVRGLNVDRPPSDVSVYRRVAKSIYALAQAGRVVLVGRGGVFLTRRLPGGLHIRLIAPFEERVERYQVDHATDRRTAEKTLREIEERRAAFYKRFWPSQSLGPDTFDATFNTARLSEAQLAEAILPLVPGLSETQRSKQGAPLREH